MKHKLDQINATLYWKDTPLFDVEVDKGYLISEHIYEENRRLLPIEFLRRQAISTYELNDFLTSRMVPHGRHNLPQLLALCGIPEYSWENFLSVNYGLSTDDHYWFKPAGSTVTYDEIRVR